MAKKIPNVARVDNLSCEGAGATTAPADGRSSANVNDLTALRDRSDEWFIAHGYLDERRVPRDDGNGNVYSLLGRIECITAVRDDLLAALKAVTEHMDRAGGDGHGMPECPWCQSGPENDGSHASDCELLAARAAIAKAEAK